MPGVWRALEETLQDGGGVTPEGADAQAGVGHRPQEDDEGLLVELVLHTWFLGGYREGGAWCLASSYLT